MDSKQRKQIDWGCRPRRGRLINSMALPLQTTVRRATEADFDALADVMFAAVREEESPYTEASVRLGALTPAASFEGHGRG